MRTELNTRGTMPIARRPRSTRPKKRTYEIASALITRPVSTRADTQTDSMSRPPSSSGT